MTTADELMRSLSEAPKRTLDDDTLSNFIQNFEKIPPRDENFEFPDLLGAACRYLIKYFADSAGKKAGEFYTPADVVRTLVEAVEPQPGMSVHDPTCGSGGMPTQTRDYIREIGGDPRGTPCRAQSGTGFLTRFGTRLPAARRAVSCEGCRERVIFSLDRHPIIRRDRPVKVANVLPAALLALATVPAHAARTDVTLGMVLEPPNLDPTGGAAAAIDEIVYANLFEGLTRFGPDGSVQPALAASWEVEEEGRRYVFSLREGVTFHDGAEFDASDVKFSIERAQAEDSTNAQKALFANIESVEVVDPATAALNLAEPDGNLPFNLAWGDAVILDPASAGSAATDPVGTGPFRFERWVQGDRVELVRAENYWGEPARLDKATFRFISEPTAAFSAMMAGDVDAFPNFPAPENLVQFESDPRFSVVIGSTEGETILAMNNAEPPLDDVRVRRAIARAIDRAEIIDGAMYGYGTPIGSHFAPHNPAYVDLVDQSATDREAAKALLEEAGHADGLTLSLKLPPPAYARRGGEIIAAQLRDIGIETEIENLEWAQWLEQVFKGRDFDLTIVSHTEPMDIDIYARPDYYFQYDDADFQALMADFATETDEAERARLLGEAQATIAEDQVNAYLFQLAKTGVAAAGLEGLWENSPTQANDLTAVYWEE